MLLLSKAQIFGLEARILVNKLCPDPAHCIRRPPEELFAKGASLPDAPEHVIRITLFHRSMRRPRGSKRPPGAGLGAGALVIAKWTSLGIRPGVGPPTDEEPKIDFSHSPSMIKGGMRGKPDVPQEDS